MRQKNENKKKYNTQHWTTNNITGPLPTKTNKTSFISKSRAGKNGTETCPNTIPFDAAAAVYGKSNMDTTSIP